MLSQHKPKLSFHSNIDRECKDSICVQRLAVTELFWPWSPVLLFNSAFDTYLTEVKHIPFILLSL